MTPKMKYSTMQMHADDDPRHVDGRHGLGKLEDLPRNDQIHDISDEHQPDEDGTATRTAAVVATRGSGIDMLLGRCMRGL